MGLKHPYKTNGPNYEHWWDKTAFCLSYTCTSYGIRSINKLRLLKLCCVLPVVATSFLSGGRCYLFA